MVKKYKWVLGALMGAVVGFAYYAFVGCRTGACPLTGNPVVSTLYGGLLGTLLFWSSGRGKENKKQQGE